MAVLRPPRNSMISVSDLSGLTGSPQIVTVLNTLGGRGLMLTGSRFKGISQASGGNFQDSSTNYPVVQLRDIDNSQVVFSRWTR